jgi:hypothetical protein
MFDSALAGYLNSCLSIFDIASNAKSEWSSGKNKFTDKELQLIVNALLFSCSCDVCIDGYRGQKKMLDLAIRIKEEHLVYPSDNIYVSGSVFEEEEITKKILEKFPIRHEV